MDDIIIVGKTFSEHLQNLQEVFARLRQAHLKLKATKCSLFQKEVSYLGHIVSDKGVSTDPAKTAKVAHWPVPTTVKEVQQFLGLANYYRRFVKDFATIARPLHRLTEDKRQFQWTTECQESFEELRRRLVTAPVLAYPNPSQEFILDTDASDVGIGAVLSQLGTEGEQVIAYASRALTKPERRYCVTRRELLSVVSFIDHFRPYLLGRHFTLRTDHGSLVWLQNFREPEGQLARWLEKLQEYNFIVAHRSGRRHNNADALSRLPCTQCGREEPTATTAEPPTHSHVEQLTSTLVDTEDQLTPPPSLLPFSPLPPPPPEPLTPPPTVKEEESDAVAQQPTPPLVVKEEVGAIALLEDSTSDLRRAQLQDSVIGPVLCSIESGEKPSQDQMVGFSQEHRRLLQQWEQLELKNGLLHRRYENDQGTQIHLQLVIPRALRPQVLQELHAGVSGGHLGEGKTANRLKERFYWPGHWEDV